MAQFDVYRNPNARLPEDAVYFVLLQSDFVEHLDTRLVAPLYREATTDRTAGRLFPRFVIDGEAFLMFTPEMAGIASGAIGVRIGTFTDRHDDIIAAVDMLISGF